MNGEVFKNTNIDFTKFDKIIFDLFPIVIPNSTRDNADLYDLVQQFKQKAVIPDDYSKDNRFDNSLYRQLTGQLREINTPEEMGLIRKAIKISCQGQNEVMKALRPDMSELEIQGLHEYVHKKYGAEEVGKYYPHGLSHHIGLDVHDRGFSQSLKKGWSSLLNQVSIFRKVVTVIKNGSTKKYSG